MRLFDLLSDFDAALEWEVDDLLLGEDPSDQPPTGWTAASD